LIRTTSPTLKPKPNTALMLTPNKPLKPALSIPSSEL
jgi:hypothetical protein